MNKIFNNFKLYSNNQLEISTQASNLTLTNNPVLFDSWNEYQIKLLFNFWNTQYKWQFALTCIIIFASSILLQYIFLLLKYIEYKILEVISNNNERDVEERRHLVFKKSDPKSSACLKFGYFITSFAFYALFLILSLIATTLNPCIFMSLVFGYSLGSVLTLNKLMALRVEYSYVL